MVSQLSYLYNGKPMSGKTAFTLKQASVGSCHNVVFLLYSYCKDKMVSWPSYLIKEIPVHGKTVFILKQSPCGSCHMVQYCTIKLITKWHPFFTVMPRLNISLYPPKRSLGGVYWIHPVRPSVCPSVRPSVRPSIRPSVRPSVRGSVSGW